MGLSKKFKSFFKKKEEEKSVEESLSKLGIDVVSDKKLEERIRLINDLHELIESPILSDEPLERIAELRDRLQWVNRTLKIVAVPYGRAGEQLTYRQAMQGWEILYSVAMDIINTVEAMVKAASQQEQFEIAMLDSEQAVKQVQELLDNGNADAEEIVDSLTENSEEQVQEFFATTFKIDVRELERKLESFLQIEVFPYAFLIMDISYYDKDVAPSYTTIVQNFGAPYVSPREPWPAPLGKREEREP